MGLIKAALGSAGDVLADQWRSISIVTVFPRMFWWPRV